MPSPEYTITMTPGTYDAVERCLKRVTDAAYDAEATPNSYEELTAGLRRALHLSLNLHRSLLGSLMHSNTYDGNVRLCPDGPEGIYFRYDSGYHGAMVLHDGHDPNKARWSVHT